MTRLLLLVVLLLFAACGRSGADILRHPLVTGGTLEDRVSSEAASVVLVIDAADIATCGNPISRWMEWGHRNPGRLSLVLKQIPDEAARRQLLLYRLQPAAVLSPSRAAERLPTPYEYLVEHGRVVFSQQVPAGTPESPLLVAMEEGQVATLLKPRSSR